jgi:hypothetical protein
MSLFIKNYKKEMVKILKRQFESLDQQQIDSILDKIIKERIKTSNEEVLFTNKYTKTEEFQPILKIADASLSKSKPIMAGNGVFFKQHENAPNPTANMLEYILATRKKAKKDMFKHINDQDKTLYKIYDVIQKVMKVLANSYYGASGESNSIFYDRDMGAAVTYTGVQIITTAVLAFEAFLSSNVAFNNIDDILIFIERVLSEDYQYEVADVIDNEKFCDLNKLYDYLVEKTKKLSPDDLLILEDTVCKLSKEECTRLYYKNNLNEFIKNKNILEELHIYSKHNFSNVKNPPEEIKESLESLWDILKEFVVYNHLYEDRLERCMSDKRKSVLIVDTDSNFINLNPFCNFMKSKFKLDYSDFDKKLSVIDIMIYFLDHFIKLTLEKFTENINVPEDKRPLINMKNEFLYKRIMLTQNKKQYAGLLLAQEGNLINPPKLDMKGMSVKKVNVNMKTREFFTDMIKNDMLSSDNINISSILKKFKEFEDTIRESILSGSVEFSTPSKLNDIDSYKAPLTIPPVRGTIAWNHLYPENLIIAPNKVNTFKLIAKEVKDIQCIAGTEWYDIIFEKIFNNEEMKKYGFSVISIPKNVKQVPEWIIPLISLDEIINDNIRNGIIILESLGVKILNILDDGYFSNIINF